MPDHHDTVLIERARIQRERLGSALLHGRVGERRTVNDHAKRLMGSIVVAAIACAACGGLSLVSRLLTSTPLPSAVGAVTP